MSFNPDDYLDNADWTKGSGPADLSITNWPELVAFLRSHEMSLREFARLPIFYRSPEKWRKILLTPGRPSSSDTRGGKNHRPN